MGEQVKDRKQLCDEYTDQYPDDEWDADLHVMIGDYNFEDGWLFGAIAKVAAKLKKDRGNQDLRRRLLLLVDLLKAPLPDGWDDEDVI